MTARSVHRLELSRTTLCIPTPAAVDPGNPHAGRNRIGPVLAVLAILAFLAVPVSGAVIVEYFHAQGCTNCIKTDPVIDSIVSQYGDRITLDSIEIDDRSGIRLLTSYGVTEVPAVVINHNRVLTSPEITGDRLREEIGLAESGAYPVPAARKSLLSRDPVIAVLFSFALGIMTGLSPCLLGSLVVLVAAAGGQAAAGRSMRYTPLVFGSGILAAYLAVAACILGAGLVFMPDAGSRAVIFGMGGIVAIVVGSLQLGLFRLPDRLGSHSAALIARFHTMPGFFLLGIIFAVLFAPCAIAPFLVLIETILLDSTLASSLMLVAFSLGLLAPYGIFAMVRHTSQEQLLKYSGIVQKAGGLLLIGFGIWLLLSL